MKRPDQGSSFGAREIACPACGHHVAVAFFDGGAQALATIAWPETGAAARSMPRLPLDFVRCVECGHVYNAAFDYAAVPYSDKPNLMFNRGTIWKGFIGQIIDKIAARLGPDPVVVEIGHGDGSFLGGLAAVLRRGRFLGFDPHGATSPDNRLDLRAEMFVPAHHLPDLEPDIMISRHVLEHLMNPLGFLQTLSFVAACHGQRPLAYFEVPCIDRAIETRRTVDFYYEHSSQFTTESFTRMLARSAVMVEELGHGYQGEVVYALVRLGHASGQVAHAADAAAFLAAADRSRVTIVDQIASLHRSGRRVAFWGGTGKSAAFMQRYGVDAERFPIVVDSDPAKVGTFVPGTGQEIRFRDWLLAHPVDVVVVPPQWRAGDIAAEMASCGIAADSVLIEHDGRLVDYHRDPHPYRRSS